MDFSTIKNSYLDTITKKYVCFSGNADRASFWIFFVVNFIISSILGVVFAPLAGLFTLAVLLPSIGIGIRRLHDTGRSGLWILINLIPVIGSLIYLLLCALPSQAAPANEA